MKDGFKTLYKDMIKYGGKLVQFDGRFYLKRTEFNILWPLDIFPLPEDMLCLKYGIFK